MTKPALSVVIYGLGRGGTETQLLALLPLLLAQGWQSEVFLLGCACVLKPDYLKAGLAIRRPPCPFKSGRASGVGAGLAAVLGFLKLALCTRLGTRGMLIGVLPAGSIAAGLLMLLRPPHRHIVMRRNRNHYQGKRPWLGALERALNRRAAAAIANSREVARDLLAEGINADRIAIVPNGVHAEHMASGRRSAARAALGLADDETVFLCVANLIAYKGCADLLDAFAIADGRLGRWRLLMAGRDDGIGADLAARAHRAGIADRTLWLGARDDVPALLAAADVGVLASHEEGFSNAVLEGMAAGLPMIVSDVGGNAEAIGICEAGIVVPPRDPAAIAEALVALASDPALRQRLGHRGRERAHRLYTFDACVSSFIRVFEAAVVGHSVPADLRPRE